MTPFARAVGIRKVVPRGNETPCGCLKAGRGGRREPGMVRFTWRLAMRAVEFEELASLAGQEVGVSDWIAIDQERIDKFADATGDHQWIHIDIERAKRELPGGKTIAHGFLTLSLIPMLAAKTMRVSGVSRGINYGLNRVRFTGMVPVGSRVRGRQKVLAVERRSDSIRLISEFTIEVEGQERPACLAETIGLLYP
jgi:acyl dehydratase